MVPEGLKQPHAMAAPDSSIPAEEQSAAATSVRHPLAQDIDLVVHRGEFKAARSFRGGEGGSDELEVDSRARHTFYLAASLPYRSRSLHRLHSLGKDFMESTDRPSRSMVLSSS